MVQLFNGLCMMFLAKNIIFGLFINQLMKKIMKPVFLLLCCICAFSACKKDMEAPANDKIVTEAKNLTDVAYGSHSLQKMDVYLPTNRTANTRVIIFAHGGSFISGDKSSYTSLVKELVRNDFAVLNINYRLVDDNGLYDSPVKHRISAVKIKDQVADVALAVDYAIAHAQEWQVSEQRIGLAGHSAGATLALLYSYNAINTNKVKAVANLAGSLDQTFMDIPYYNYLLPGYILEAGYRYTGYAVTSNNDVYYREISPLYVANATQKIPTLTIFPENNAVGDLPKQGRTTFDAFTNRLNTLGVPNKFVQIAGADHEFSKVGNFDLVLNETSAYFNAILK